jgi:hypothetical protein
VRTEKVALGLDPFDLDPFDLDVLRSLTRGALAAEEPLSGTLRAALSKRGLASGAGLGGRTGAISPARKGRVVVGSETTVFSMRVPIPIQGGALAGREPRLRATERVRARRRGPPELADRALEGAGLSYPLKGLPHGAEISGVEVAENRLVLSGEMERPLLGGGRAVDNAFLCCYGLAWPSESLEGDLGAWPAVYGG